jgi:SAM-dependent methyltransferase
MQEARKTQAIRGPEFAATYFSGSVLDIGAGDDPVAPNAKPFDIADGDANRILDYLAPASFDCVHSSHCLEHMRDVPAALTQWWALVKPGGYMILVVPDEDLYEQGIWPSVFNGDHKATFRLGKLDSWSPCSYEIGSLVRTLPGCEIIQIELQDANYDRRLQRHGAGASGRLVLRLRPIRERMLARASRWGPLHDRLMRWTERVEYLLGSPIDQTRGQALAQIQAVLRKAPGA